MNQAQKPEYVLKRANDLINTSSNGNGDKEKLWALELLHSFIGAKKKVVQWSKVFESIMKRHLELCVDLRNHLFAKDGLHQYRNLCQSLDPGSLEIVILHLLDLTEARTTAARQRANKVALAAATNISDLDQEESPESIMLSSMTEEGDRERTNREVVVPWLKFLWETYRAVLELLSKIPKLEKVYHKTCEKAFKFCQDYERKMEFRRLCEMLRAHLASLQRSAATPTANRSPRHTWDWTPESIELHLQTRFLQLEGATNLELWNEGFRTVDDIYSIMLAGRKTPRPKLMSVYYEKLTRIFWVSENYLFHAYAWLRYYNLVSEFRKDIKSDERSILASSVLLAALSVPSLKDAEQAASVATALPSGADDEEHASEKQQQMATLLDFEANPTRKALIADIASRGLLADVPAELSALFNNLEVKFHPLTLSKSLVSAIAYVKSVPQLAIYAVPLQRVAVFRVVQQLSKVYDVVKISFVRKLLEGLEDITPNSIEKMMIDGVVRKQFQLRVDHIAQCVRFGATATDATVVDGHIQAFGNRLSEVIRVVDQSIVDEASAAEARRSFLQKVANAADKEHAALLDRKNIIEQRKIEVEKVQEERERIAILIAEEDARRRKEEEDARLEKERIDREIEKARIQAEKEEVKRIRRELEKFNVFKEESELIALTSAQRHALVAEAKQSAARAKEEHERKLNEQAKRLDHITRALRIEAGPIIVARRDAQIAGDLAQQDIDIKELEDKNREQHAINLVEKARLRPMQAYRPSFDELLVREQRAAYEKMIAKLRRTALLEHRAVKLATARKLHYEEMQRREEEEELERERKIQEENQRQEQELYERTRKARMEKEERERELEREKESKARELEAQRQQLVAERKAALQEKAAAASAPAKPATSSWGRSEAPASSGSAGFGASGGAWRSKGAAAAAAAPAPSSNQGRGDEPSSGGWRSKASAAAPEGETSGWRRGPGPAAGDEAKQQPAEEGRWSSVRGSGDRDRERDRRPTGGFGSRPSGGGDAGDNWRKK